MSHDPALDMADLLSRIADEALELHKMATEAASAERLNPAGIGPHELAIETFVEMLDVVGWLEAAAQPRNASVCFSVSDAMAAAHHRHRNKCAKRGLVVLLDTYTAWDYIGEVVERAPMIPRRWAVERKWRLDLATNEHTANGGLVVHTFVTDRDMSWLAAGQWAADRLLKEVGPRRSDQVITRATIARLRAPAPPA